MFGITYVNRFNRIQDLRIVRCPLGEVQLAAAGKLYTRLEPIADALVGPMEHNDTETATTAAADAAAGTSIPSRYRTAFAEQWRNIVQSRGRPPVRSFSFDAIRIKRGRSHGCSGRRMS